MRNPLPFLVAVALLGLSACTSRAPEPDASTPPEVTEETTVSAGVPFLALHLYNPASDEAHRQFLDLLSELNEAVSGTGLSDAQYGAWKVTGEQAGEYGYAFGSIWADRSTYDAVHGHDTYRAVIARAESAEMEPFQAEVYNRYLLLNPSSDESPPAPAAEPTLLSMHLLNLDSAEEEAQFIDILEAGNAAIASAGHPETRYGLWKVTGDQTGDYGYMFASLWADRATYDAVHEHPDYVAFAELHGDAYEALATDQVHNRYEPATIE